MANYLGITFGGEFKDFAEFKKMFSNVWVFKQFLPDEKEKHLQKAYKVATGKDAKDELSRSRDKSKKAKSINGKQSTVSRDKKD